MQAVIRAHKFCEEHDFSTASRKIKASLIVLNERGSASAMDHSSIATELRNIIESIYHEAESRKFLWVPISATSYVDQDALFGETVAVSFPSAQTDIREAGNCIAADCNTVAVFHLMCVAEYGLRALAWDRRIKLPKGGLIELATWESVIRELEKSEDKIRNCPKTLAREAQYTFYHGAMMQYRRFKNTFRNRVAHTRGTSTPTAR